MDSRGEENFIVGPGYREISLSRVKPRRDE